MSYNPNFYNNFHGNNVTFQSVSYSIPPPPLPPAYFIPPIATETVDKEFVKKYELKKSTRQLTPTKVTSQSISKVREDLQNSLLILNDIKSKYELLTKNIDNFSDEEWSSHLQETGVKQALISKILSQIKGPSLDMMCKLLAKRSAKRLRQKRVNQEKKKEKELRKKDMEEKSRKIDENLQKIKDNINKAKQEEEAKLQADLVLKEVLRKTHDAKKCIVKLEALLKLHKARLNTAKGRGESVPEAEVATFNDHIEKLKSLWTKKLTSYEKEELELRNKLKEDSEQQETSANVKKQEVISNLELWKEVMFGGGLPQVDFAGDVGQFVAIRSKWDRYIDTEGTPLPVGWVTPST